VGGSRQFILRIFVIIVIKTHVENVNSHSTTTSVGTHFKSGHRGVSSTIPGAKR